MQTKFLIISLLLIYGTTTFSQNQIVGKWLSKDKEAITSIYEHNGKFYGKLTWLKTPKDENGKPVTDTENPNEKLKDELSLGLVILNDFSFKDNKWKGGKVYDPKDGNTYDCTMWLTGENKLNVRGYLGWLYTTIVGTRTN